MSLIPVTVNGEPHEVPESATIQTLLQQLEIDSPAIAVELNFEIQPRSKFAHQVLKAGDSLEIVTLVGGG